MLTAGSRSTESLPILAFCRTNSLTSTSERSSPTTTLTTTLNFAPASHSARRREPTRWTPGDRLSLFRTHPPTHSHSQRHAPWAALAVPSCANKTPSGVTRGPSLPSCPVRCTPATSHSATSTATRYALAPYVFLLETRPALCHL